MIALLRARHAGEREIGPIGAIGRVLAGAAAIALPVALEGIGRWDVPALVAAPLFATAAARLIALLLERTAPTVLVSRHAICSPAGCALVGLVFAAAFALGAVTPVNGDVVFWGFLGVSMLLAAVRGDGGCEVLAFPNAITGRQDRIGCILLTPIDAAEARHRASNSSEQHPRAAMNYRP